ncbi:hypothetical protein EVAR_83929_1 [Eumeta japonica]|uniref:Integrase zinc-binding domain-containing protein n=1 Tax=Eumeta variegata TaxID=151549 RepID=A0A4C1XV96_EUMVA|nr:hypothetical protein EVAR_83929_1 [Eumeta japonica]
MKEVHDEPWTGKHFGLTKTLVKFRERHFVRNVEKEMKKYIKSCSRNENATPSQRLRTSRCVELVSYNVSLDGNDGVNSAQAFTVWGRRSTVEPIFEVFVFQIQRLGSNVVRIGTRPVRMLRTVGTTTIAYGTNGLKSTPRHEAVPLRLVQFRARTPKRWTAVTFSAGFCPRDSFVRESRRDTRALVSLSSWSVRSDRDILLFLDSSIFIYFYIVVSVGVGDAGGVGMWMYGVWRRLRGKGSNLRSGPYLLQALSVVIQYRNTASVMGIFRPGQTRGGIVISRSLFRSSLLGRQAGSGYCHHVGDDVAGSPSPGEREVVEIQYATQTEIKGWFKSWIQDEYSNHIGKEYDTCIERDSGNGSIVENGIEPCSGQRGHCTRMARVHYWDVTLAHYRRELTATDVTSCYVGSDGPLPLTNILFPSKRPATHWLGSRDPGISSVYGRW